MDLDQRTHEFTTITVALEDREDGGLRVFSDDLPGLILSGPHRQKVIETIVPAMTAILEHLGFVDFQIHHTKPMTEIMDGENPQTVDMRVQQFVVEYLKAA